MQKPKRWQRTPLLPHHRLDWSLASWEQMRWQMRWQRTLLLPHHRLD